MFGKRADAVSQYLLKGQQVGVVGEISMREWDDRQGQKRTSLEVRVSDLTLLGKRGESGSGAPSQPPQQQSQPQTSQAPQHTAATGGLDDDVPFMRAGHGALWRCM
jgi:single-strand DNA-binding protein